MQRNDWWQKKFAVNPLMNNHIQVFDSAFGKKVREL